MNEHLKKTCLWHVFLASSDKLTSHSHNNRFEQSKNVQLKYRRLDLNCKSLPTKKIYILNKVFQTMYFSFICSMDTVLLTKRLHTIHFITQLLQWILKLNNGICSIIVFNEQISSITLIQTNNAFKLPPISALHLLLLHKCMYCSDKSSIKLCTFAESDVDVSNLQIIHFFLFSNTFFYSNLFNFLIMIMNAP